MFRNYRIAAIALGLISALEAAAHELDTSAANRRSTETNVEDITPGAVHREDAFSVPVRIVESIEDAERAARRETDADHREQHDLAAQQAMAESTKEIVIISWWQLGLATAGTILVFGSLGAAFWSNHIARDTARRQLRAYVCLNSAEVVEPPDDLGFKAFIDFVNFGQTPAHDVVIRCRTKTVGRISLDSFDRDLAMAEATEPSVLGPGAGMRKNIDNILHPQELAEILAESCVVVIIGDVNYLDIFGCKQTTRFCLRVRYLRTDRQRIHPMEFGNTAS